MLLRRAILIGALSLLSASAHDVPRSQPLPAAAAPPMVHLPAMFVANNGQWDPAVQFALVGGGTVSWIHDDGWTSRFERWSLPQGHADERAGAVVRTRFCGAQASGEGRQRQEGVFHFLRGNVEQHWVHDAPAYAQVQLRRLLPGVDLLLRQGRGAAAPELFEYDLLLQPGADLQAVVAECVGVDHLALAADGALLSYVPLPDGGEVVLRQQPPVAWQEVAGQRRSTAVAFRLLGPRRYGFCAPSLDASLPLVVDPAVQWNSLIGGGSSDSVNSMRWVPGQGIYLGGWTGSLDFPTTPGAFRTTGQRDGFIAKMREDGTGLLYATYLGGSGSEEVRGIAVDPGGGVAAVGWTLSTDFPVTAGAVQPTFGGTSQVLSIGDAFVAHLAPGGGSLLGATYLGGLLEESGEAVEIDASGAMTVAGWTSSPNFPVSAGAFQPNLHGPLTLQTDGFLARVSSDAHTLVFSTYFGGNFHDQLLGLKVDGLGTAFVVGWSGSANFPVTSNAYRTSIAGDDDIVVAHFSATGGLIWSTYLGGLGVDIGHAIALDSAGNVWIAGSTGSTNFPTTAGAGQRQLAGGRDGFLAELDNSGSSLLYGAYLGGPGDEIIRALAIEANGNKLLVGEASDGFPTTANALQPGFGGGSLDGLIIELDAAGSTVTFASYLGGVNEDVFGAVATSPGGSAVIAGWTWSPDWPTTVGAFQRSLHGIEDGCVLRLDTLSFGGRFAFGGGDDLGSTLFVPDTEVGMLALAVANQTSRPLWLDQVRVFVGGSADNLVDVADVSLWLDQPGTPGRTDLRLAGPVPLTGDHVIVELPVTGLPALQPGERQALTVTVRARAGCRPGAEIACSLLGQDGFVVHSDGLAGGAQVGMLGPELLTRAVACLRAPVFPGDFDGDGRITVADLRQLAMHLGEAAGAFDADGDGAVGVHDLELVGARILGLPVLRAQPTVVSRDSLLTLRGYDLAAITTATLGGRSLQLVAPSYGELTLRIDAGIAGGEQELLIQGRDRPLLQTTVQVQ